LVLSSKKKSSEIKPGLSYNVILVDIIGNTVEIPVLTTYQNGIIALASDLGDRVTNFVKVDFKIDNFSNLNLSSNELKEKMELPLLVIKESETEIDAFSKSKIEPGSIVVFKSIINGAISLARIIKKLALGIYLVDKNVNLSLLVPTTIITNNSLELNDVKKLAVSPCRLAYSQGAVVGAVNCQKNSIKKFIKSILLFET